MVSALAARLHRTAHLHQLFSAPLWVVALVLVLLVVLSVG